MEEDNSVNPSEVFLLDLLHLMIKNFTVSIFDAMTDFPIIESRFMQVNKRYFN